jgi:beta-lactamase class C
MQACGDKALPHFWTGYNWRSDSISPLYYNSAAAGGVNASISDMGEWLKLLLGHQPQVVADSTLDKVFTPIIKTGKERRIFPHWIGRDDASYALGWRVLQHGSDTIVYHGGYVNGFRSEIAFNRRDDVGICVLFNASSDLSSACIPAFFNRWEKVRATAGQ